MQVIPAVDVLGGKAVRLQMGRYEAVTEYGRDPIAAAIRFIDQGAELVHVVDLAAARDGVGDPDLWQSFGTAGVPFSAAGGIRTPAAAKAAIAGGAERIVVGTAAVLGSETLGSIVAAVGSERVAASLDVRDGLAHGSGWQDSGRPAGSALEEMVGAGVGRIMVTSIARDGMLTGPDVDLIRWVVDRVPVPVAAAGGIGSLEDLRPVAEAGAEAAILGRALYERRFSLTEAVAEAAGL